jgi:Fic-DOC domain mobile mystery protein B
MVFDYPDGATPLDPNEISGLIPLHITTQEELNAWEEKNILKAQSWALKQGDILSLSFIKKLHKYMFNETWRWAGKFRNSDKNIGVNWNLIPEQVKILCDTLAYQLHNETYPLDEVGVRFHHRLVSIHPFPNGNGRHARLMADLLIIEQGNSRFTWGQYDLYKETSFRKQYIEALKLADKGDYSKLVVFARS